LLASGGCGWIARAHTRVGDGLAFSRQASSISSWRMMARTAGAIAPSSYRLRSQASSSHRRAVELVSRSICNPPKSPLARPLEVGLQGRRQPCLEALGVAVAVGFEPTKDPGRTLARF